MIRSYMAEQVSKAEGGRLREEEERGGGDGGGGGNGRGRRCEGGEGAETIPF